MQTLTWIYEYKRMLFYWIYGDSTIEIYLASVFFWDYDLIHRELAGSFGTGEALDQNPFAAIGPFFFLIIYQSWYFFPS